MENKTIKNCPCCGELLGSDGYCHNTACEEYDSVAQDFGSPEETPEYIVSDELVQIWIDQLLEKKGKASMEELTKEELEEEVDEVAGAIGNEKLWALAEPYPHIENIVNLSGYMDVLMLQLEAFQQPVVAAVSA